MVIVQINPIGFPGTPYRARDILARVNAITANSSLMARLRAIDFVTHLLDEEQLDPGRYKRMLIHLIDGEFELTYLDASSKFNAERALFGRAARDGPPCRQPLTG